MSTNSISGFRVPVEQQPILIDSVAEWMDGVFPGGSIFRSSARFPAAIDEGGSVVSDLMPAPPDITSRVHDFLSNDLILDDSVQLADSTPLLNGLIDSIGLMELVSFLEDEFAITLENEDVDAVNFRTTADIARLVSRRIQGT